MPIGAGKDANQHRLYTGWRVAPVIFSATYIAFGKFVTSALPGNSIAVPTQVVVLLALGFFVIPAGALYLLEWALSKRPSPKAQFTVRGITIGVALALAVRQLQLYPPTNAIADDLAAFSPGVLAAVVLFSMGFVFWIGFRFQRGLSEAFYYFAFPTVVLVGAFLMHDWSANRNYAGYSINEIEAQRPESGPPIVIVVFDMLSYEALLGSDGHINGEDFPNFASLAEDSLALRNATTNFFWTEQAVPYLVDSVLPLADWYSIRLYDETPWTEHLYSEDCSVRYTCRGARFLTLSNEFGLTRDIAGHFLNEIAQTTLGQDAIPARLLGSSEAVATTSGGFHWLTEDLFAEFLKDIDASKSSGRVYFLHTNLPHDPFVFDSQGHILEQFGRFDYESSVAPGDEEFQRLWTLYQGQVGYADMLLGTILTRLREEDLYEDAVLIVTADHGLRTAYPQGDGPVSVDSLPARVPMFIHGPAIEPGTSDVDYQHIDFGPTLYDLMNFETTVASQPRTTFDLKPGTSIFESDRPQRKKQLFVGYDNSVFWRYEYDESSKAWSLAETKLGEYVLTPDDAN